MQQDRYLIATLVEKYRHVPNYIQILFEQLKLPSMSIEDFAKLCQSVGDPWTERRRYQKELEAQIVKVLQQEELELGEHFFYLVFSKISQEYKQLLRFSTSIGEFGISYVQQKYRMQCYWQPDPRTGHVHRHEEIILQEILLTIQKGLQEKIISDSESNELHEFIHTLKDQVLSHRRHE